MARSTTAQARVVVGAATRQQRLDALDVQHHLAKVRVVRLVGRHRVGPPTRGADPALDGRDRVDQRQEHCAVAHVGSGHVSHQRRAVGTGQHMVLGAGVCRDPWGTGRLRRPPDRANARRIDGGSIRAKRSEIERNEAKWSENWVAGSLICPKSLASSGHEVSIAPRQHLLRLRQAAKLLGVPTSWLRREADAGRIPFLLAGRARLFDPKVVAQVLKQRSGQWTPPSDRGGAH